MTTLYFVDAQGNYIGGFDSGTDAPHPDVPPGAIEVPAPPGDARQKWSGAAWGAVPPPAPLPPELDAVTLAAALIAKGVLAAPDVTGAVRSNAGAALAATVAALPPQAPIA